MATHMGGGVAKHIFTIKEALKDHKMPQSVLVWGMPKGEPHTTS